jgi:hypothetical protein
MRAGHGYEKLIYQDAVYRDCMNTVGKAINTYFTEAYNEYDLRIEYWVINLCLPVLIEF